MPKRLEIFYKGGFFHIFNKSIDHKSIFTSNSHITLFKNTLLYYKTSELKFKYSRSRRNNKQEVNHNSQSQHTTCQQNFSCLAYAFMPNHFHLLLRQDNKISLSNIMRRILISFTRTYNLLNNRSGPIFIPQFKAVEIHNQNQLIHVSRYIHLNPYSSGLLISPAELLTCPLTSFPNYLNKDEKLCEIDFLLELFSYDKGKYQNFVLNNAEYQKRLENIKKSGAS